jgi:hypothetical protein
MLKWGKLSGLGSVFELGDTMLKVFLSRSILTATAVGFCSF